MRILIAVHGFPPTATGGAEREAARAAQRLAAHGHDVFVICTDSVAAAHSELRMSCSVEDGVTVRRLYLNLDAGGDPFTWSYDNPLVGEAIKTTIAEFEPDVLHLFSGYLMSASSVRAARAAGVPVVVSLMDYWWLCHRITLVRTDGSRCDGPTPIDCARCEAEMFRRFRYPARVAPPIANVLWSSAGRSIHLAGRLGAERHVTRRDVLSGILDEADAIIAPSSYLASRYTQFGIDPSRLRIWRQGVDVNRCCLRRPSSEFRVGYLGQVKRHKGVDLLVDAWSKLEGPRERRLVIHGTDHGEEQYGTSLRKAINRLDNVEWSGAFRGNEVWEILSNLDVVVVPSRWVENSPNTILEARAMGVPVIGTNLGGIAELVQHEWNGLVFEVDDSDDLARQLQRLLDEPELLPRLRLAENSFRTAEDDYDRIEGLYRSLRDQRRSGASSPPVGEDRRVTVVP